MRKYWTVPIGIFSWLIGLQYANADWQYTNWEMTPAQVIGASGGRVVTEDKPLPGPGPNRGLLKGDYSTGQFQFRVVFFFNENTNQLSLVQLTLLNPTLGKTLEQSLISKYGKPFDTDHTSLFRIVEWRDGANNNRIELVHVGSSLVELRYYPLKTRDNKGL